MTTKSDIINFLKKIGTKERPINTLEWITQLFFAVCIFLIMLYAIHIAPKDFLTIFLFGTSIFFCFFTILFLLFGLFQYVKHKNC